MNEVGHLDKLKSIGPSIDPSATTEIKVYN